MNQSNYMNIIEKNKIIRNLRKKFFSGVFANLCQC